MPTKVVFRVNQAGLIARWRAKEAAVQLAVAHAAEAIAQMANAERTAYFSKRPLGIDMVPYFSGGSVMAGVRAVKTDKVWGFWVYGTQPHDIWAKNAPNLVFWWTKQDMLFVGPHVNHPGTKEHLNELMAFRQFVRETAYTQWRKSISQVLHSTSA